MSISAFRKKHVTLPLFVVFLFMSFSVFAAPSEKHVKTSIEAFILQKHDREPIKDAEVFFQITGKKYKGFMINKGMYKINDIALTNPVVNRGTISVTYRDVCIYSKKVLLFNIPENKLRIEIRGSIAIPAPPRLDTMYTYTNEKFEKFSGGKDIYSSVYINGEIAEGATYSTRWKTYRKLDPGLNTLIFTSKNIWKGTSEPFIFHITYFPVTVGEMKFFNGPGNVRSERDNTSSTVSWDGIESEEVIGYNVYRSGTSGKNYKRINKNIVKESSFIDTEPGKGECYYVVTAVFPDYETSFSDEVSSILNSLPGTDIPDKIEGDLRLSASKSPYLVSSKVIVSEGASLTIEPGVEVRFKKGNTYISGKIIAEGEDANPIVFTSDQKNAKKGSWRGIEAKDGSSIKNSVIEYAGSGGKDAVSLEDNASFTENIVKNNLSSGIGIKTGRRNAKVLVSGNTVTNNGNCGIYAENISGGTYIDISGNEIKGNTGRGISTAANSNITDNVIRGNGFGDVVEIRGGNINNKVAWDKGTYSLDSSVKTGGEASLTLNPGVTVKSAPGVEIRGKISARGTKNEKINFTSLEEELGEFWDGLVLDDGSNLENCTVSYVLGPKDGIYRKGKNVSIVEVKAFFTEQKTNVFNLEELTNEVIGEEYKGKSLVEKVSQETTL